jgi:tripartite-type tricarboxylate transporter receptor subunit TctC
MMGTVASLATNVSLEKLRYDPLRDFAPITLVGLQDLVLVVGAASPAQTVADVVQLARKDPSKFSYSSAGRGTGGHLSGELFSQLSGVPMLHVPYKGVAQAVNDVIGGQVTLTFASLATAQPLVLAGKVRPIAVTGRKRSDTYPQLPTMEEAGMKGYESSTWYALIAPAGTPQAVVQRINAELVAMLKEPQVREQFKDEGIDLVGSTPPELTAHMKEEIEKWRRVIRGAGLDKSQ